MRLRRHVGRRGLLRHFEVDRALAGRRLVEIEVEARRGSGRRSGAAREIEVHIGLRRSHRLERGDRLVRNIGTGVVEGLPEHGRVLPDLQGGEVESERLRLPDQVLQLALGDARGARPLERVAQRQ